MDQQVREIFLISLEGGFFLIVATFFVCVCNHFVWTGVLLPDGGPGEVCEGHPQAAPGKLVGRTFQ